MKPKIIIIFGPTSSGKTALSLQLAEHLKAMHGLGSEVIGADSRQVYKGMSVGTSKVSRKIRASIPHHNLDVEVPTRQYTSERFVADAERLIKGISDRGNIPIIVGGTGTYIMALVGNVYLNSAPTKAIELNSLLLVPEFTREALYKKISSTVDSMFESGLYNELKQLIKTYGRFPSKSVKRLVMQNL